MNGKHLLLVLTDPKWETSNINGISFTFARSHFKAAHFHFIHTVWTPLRWLQSSIPSIPHRQVVCFIQIKPIIFHACTHAASASYTFTRYYLRKVSWLWNTLLQIKRWETCQNPTLKAMELFLESLAALSLQSAGLPRFEIGRLPSPRQRKLQFSSKSLLFCRLHRWAEVSSSRRLKLSAQ